MWSQGMGKQSGGSFSNGCVQEPGIMLEVRHSTIPQSRFHDGPVPRQFFLDDPGKEGIAPSSVQHICMLPDQPGLPR
jgi:hypothetical protein